MSVFDLLLQFVISQYPLNLYFTVQKKKHPGFNHFRSSCYCFVPIGIAIYLHSLLPPGNSLWISYSVLVLFLSSVGTNFNLCSIPLIKTCSLFLLIALTSGYISLNWHSTFHVGSWRVSQSRECSSFYLLIYFIFCFRLFWFCNMTSHCVSSCVVVFLSKPIWVDFGE